MRRLRISHLTEYRFAQPVTLEPHRLLLRPREGHGIRIESSTFEIFPAAQVTWHRDVFDNRHAAISGSGAVS
jgi:Bacterial transglutaminase-like N-terminal region